MNNIKGSRMMAMLGVFSALLGQGVASGSDVPRAANFGGSRYRGRAPKQLSPKAFKLRKSKKRQENKSRAINAKVKRYA